MGSVICRAESGDGTWCCMYSVIEGLSIVQNVSLLVLKNDIERLKTTTPYCPSTNHIKREKPMAWNSSR